MKTSTDDKLSREYFILKDKDKAIDIDIFKGIENWKEFPLRHACCVITFDKAAADISDV